MTGAIRAFPTQSVDLKEPAPIAGPPLAEPRPTDKRLWHWKTQQPGVEQDTAMQY